ncbi:MAG: MBL fold metallo-hydrolase [Proteobacteria bacterium]|jgi:glyoxylase-like metal-dependent hydrolase (beta-lactamase superfamily II)|nr:MBL fold metallo-hydrolase [Pseudomonadota bacterium]
MRPTPEIHTYFDEATNAACHIIKDPSSNVVAIIDSILDFDAAAGRTHTKHADMLIDVITRNGWQVAWILETHGHADHLSAAPYLAEKLGGKVAIGSNISVVQKTFGKIFNAGTEFEMDGSQFDRLFADGDTFAVGNLNIAVMHTPGHTPACVTYVTGDAAFIGDTLFMPDFGTARADFPGGSASDLYTSIQRILGLPDETRLFLCHDYKTKTRDTFCWQTTVAEQKVSNVHVGGGKSQDEFVDFRTKRDAQLDMPKLIIPSIQVNMNAGKMPAPDAHGDVYLKVPINKL